MKSIGKIAHLGASVTIAIAIKPKVINMSKIIEIIASTKRWPDVAAFPTECPESFCP